MIIIHENRRLWEVNHRVESISNTEIKVTVDEFEEVFDLSFLEDGERYVLEDSLVLPYNPISGIIKENGVITVTTFYDNPHKRGIEADFKRESKKIILVPSENNNLKIAQEKQKKLVVEGFEKELKEGHFMSSILGIEADCRRSGIKNDLQNVQGLISFMERTGQSETNYVGYTETVRTTVNSLKALCGEMEDFVLSLYNKKWSLENQINTASTIDEVKQINW